MLFGHHSSDRDEVKVERGRSFDHRSQPGTPALSRSSSVSSNVSTQSAPHWDSRDRNGSTISAESMASTKSGFGSLFKKKEKKPKQEAEKIVLTSKHAAAVKKKMMLDPKLATGKKSVKTAGVVGTQKSGHLTAEQQEMRHPHCGPPALHPLPDMPMLTRIASGDERDEEDELERNQRQRWEWEESKVPGVTRIDEGHSATVTPTDSPITSPAMSRESSPTRRPLPRTKSSFGGRWRRDEHGNWTR